MAMRVPDPAAARQAFLTLAEAEGARIPTYARLCRVIAAHPELYELLLEAPTGERLPVLLLAALHDLVLRRPDLPLAAWYPSVTGRDPSPDPPDGALLDAVRTHRDELLSVLRDRQVQTNEVNRACAWWWGLSQLTREDRRPLHLLEVGASAGLNLLLDAYAYRFDAPGGRVGQLVAGDATSPVRLGTTVRGDLPDGLGAPLPPVAGRVGLDRRPVDPADPEDRRWLAACTWPEQRVRYERMESALALAATRRPRVVKGDLVDDLERLVGEATPGSHVVVLSSWVLVYAERDRRAAFGGVLAEAAAHARRGGGRLSLLTLEDGKVLPWMDPPPLAGGSDADHVHASILAVTAFDHGEPEATPLARCQAHLTWCEPL